MKFRFGAWLWEDGITPCSMKRVAEYRIERDALFVAAVERQGTEGMDRCEGTVLQLRISAPFAGCLRVQVWHHHPRQAGVSRFDLDYAASAGEFCVREQGDDLVASSGSLALRIRRRGEWRMRFENTATGELITGSPLEGLCFVQSREHGPFVTQRLTLSVGECIYGMGERFGPLVRNGQSVAIWNEDGGTCSDISYKNVPFYLSSAGYGLLVNTPAKVEFEVATERVSQVQFAVPGEELDYYVFHGPGPKDVLEKYTRLSGRPAVPPAWSFGLWLSTSFTTRYDEKTVNEFVDGMTQRGLPLEVFHFDCFWMKERHWCEFEWDRESFPDPQGMLRRLKAKGLKICLWINPYISALSKLFEEGRREGYFLRRPDGRVFQTDLWQPAMAIVDFTNSRAAAWYVSKLRSLLDDGVDAFKTDFGERIPTDVVYHDGSDPQLMHNYYAYLYNKTVFELLEQRFGRGNALVFARSGTAGSQKFPVHWGGDSTATFESMAEELRGGLSLCLSGHAFWSHDIGGFEGTASPDVYKRWIAFGLLSSHSRLHGSQSYRVPWLFDEESVEVMRHFTRLKNRLFPYLFSAAHEAHETGCPVMRSMFLEFPDDPACRHLDRQYLLGPSLLVAPCFRGDGIVEYYLPRGRWTTLLGNETIEGGRWQRTTVGFSEVPLFARENSLIAMSSNCERPHWTLQEPLTLHLVNVRDGADLATRVYASDGACESFRCRRSGDRITLDSDGRASAVRVIVRSTRTVAEVANGRVTGSRPEGAAVEWVRTDAPLTLIFAPAEVRVELHSARRKEKTAAL